MAPQIHMACHPKARIALVSAQTNFKGSVLCPKHSCRSVDTDPLLELVCARNARRWVRSNHVPAMGFRARTGRVRPQQTCPGFLLVLLGAIVPEGTTGVGVHQRTRAPLPLGSRSVACAHWSSISAGVLQPAVTPVSSCRRTYAWLCFQLRLWLGPLVGVKVIEARKSDHCLK